MTGVESNGAHDRNYKTCGSKTKQESSAPFCERPAGWGTDHPGFGRCKLHGGVGQKTYEEQAQVALNTFGKPKVINAIEALEDELYRTAGHVEWLGMVVANLEANVSHGNSAGSDGEVMKREGLFDYQRSANGLLWREPSVWVKMYESERKHLVVVAGHLVKLGVDKKRLDVLRSRGTQMVVIFQQVLGDDRLALTEEQKNAVPELIREYIAVRQIEGNN